MRRRATSRKRTEGEETELDMVEKDATPVEDIETVSNLRQNRTKPQRVLS